MGQTSVGKATASRNAFRPAHSSPAGRPSLVSETYFTSSTVMDGGVGRRVRWMGCPPTPNPQTRPGGRAPHGGRRECGLANDGVLALRVPLLDGEHQLWGRLAGERELVGGPPDGASPPSLMPPAPTDQVPVAWSVSQGCDRDAPHSKGGWDGVGAAAMSAGEDVAWQDGLRAVQAPLRGVQPRNQVRGGRGERVVPDPLPPPLGEAKGGGSAPQGK